MKMRTKIQRDENPVLAAPNVGNVARQKVA